MLMLPMMMMMMMVAFRGQWGKKRQTSLHFAILLSMNSVHFHRDKPLDKKSLECKLYCYILCFQITLVCSCSRLRGLTSSRQIVSHTLDWRTLFLILSAVSIILKHQSRACLEDIWSLLAVSVVLSSGRGWWCCFSLEVLSWLQEQECVCVCVCVCVWVNPEICVWRRYLCIWWSQLKQNSVNCSNYQICCWFTPKCCLTPSSITHNKTVGAIIFYLCWCINRL